MEKVKEMEYVMYFNHYYIINEVIKVILNMIILFYMDLNEAVQMEVLNEFNIKISQMQLVVGMNMNILIMKMILMIMVENIILLFI
jgi:hypothetical protein